MNAVVSVAPIDRDRERVRSTPMGVDLLRLRGDRLIRRVVNASFLRYSDCRAAGIFGTTDACTSITRGNWFSFSVNFHAPCVGRSHRCRAAGVDEHLVTSSHPLVQLTCPFSIYTSLPRRGDQWPFCVSRRLSRMTKTKQRWLIRIEWKWISCLGHGHIFLSFARSGGDVGQGLIAIRLFTSNTCVIHWSNCLISPRTATESTIYFRWLVLCSASLVFVRRCRQGK